MDTTIKNFYRLLFVACLAFFAIHYFNPFLCLFHFVQIDAFAADGLSGPGGDGGSGPGGDGGVGGGGHKGGTGGVGATVMTKADGESSGLGGITAKSVDKDGGFGGPGDPGKGTFGGPGDITTRGNLPIFIGTQQGVDSGSMGGPSIKGLYFMQTETITNAENKLQEINRQETELKKSIDTNKRMNLDPKRTINKLEDLYVKREAVVNQAFKNSEKISKQLAIEAERLKEDNEAIAKQRDELTKEKEALKRERDELTTSKSQLTFGLMGATLTAVLSFLGFVVKWRSSRFENGLTQLKIEEKKLDIEEKRFNLEVKKSSQS